MFVEYISPSPITGGAQNYGSAFLPGVYQGTPFGMAGTVLTQAQIRHIKNAEVPLQLPERHGERRLRDVESGSCRAHAAIARDTHGIFELADRKR